LNQSLAPDLQSAIDAAPPTSSTEIVPPTSNGDGAMVVH
jgi:hypothetical protein